MRRYLQPLLAPAVFCGALALQPAIAGPSRACPDDRPCFGTFIVDHEGLYFDWDDFGGGRYTHYNVRWSRPGRGETQLETRNEYFTIRNPHRNTVYTLKVQGCRRPIIGASTCSQWEVRRYRTP